MDNSGEQLRDLETLCSKLMPDLRKLLGQSIASQEHEFLRLGEKLQAFSTQAGNLAEMAGEVLESVGGHEMEDVIQGFNDRLQEMREVSGTQSTDDALNDLKDISATISDLEELLREFSRLVRKLQMLGISTRIESARLGSEGVGFHTLADDVEKLGHRIEGHSSKITQHAHSLSEFTTLAMQQTGAMRSKQAECSVSIFVDIRNNTDALLEIVQESKGLSESLATSSQDVRRSIGEIVSSLQFHDIVRQQVEHVEEALEDVSNVILHGEVSQLTDHPEEADLAGWVSDVASVQLRQVTNASVRFTQAVEAIKANLQTLADSVRGMETEIESLRGHDAADSTSTLKRIEKTVDGMMATMKTFARQGEEVGTTMSSVAGTISEISAYLEDIEEVGAEIELIALNASIKAAHTGEQGAAMGVLAMSVQQLSKEASMQTDNVAGVLRRIAESAEMLGSRAADFLDTSQVTEMVEKLRKLLQQLGAIDSSMTMAFVKFSRASAELATDITRATSSLDFHQAVAGKLADASALLEELDAKARDMAPPAHAANRPERLEKLLQRYTMDAERLVHEEAVSTGEQKEREPGQTGKEEDGWDNVELF